MIQQVMTNPGEIIFREVPVPEVKDDQVLVKIMNIGICGSDIHDYSVRLEDVLQTGNHELAEFEQFLPLWIEYLGTHSGMGVKILLEEAQSMLQDEQQILDTARKFANSCPESLPPNRQHHMHTFLLLWFSGIIRSDVLSVLYKYP